MLDMTDSDRSSVSWDTLNKGELRNLALLPSADSFLELPRRVSLNAFSSILLTSVPI